MKPRGTSTLLALAAALALGTATAVPFALALEISLEENKAERGNIGYVDIQKIFRLYPGTHKAKQSYAEIVRQAEEQVNLKRAELMNLRAEITRLQLEYDLLVKAPLPTLPPPPPAPAPPVPAPSPPTIAPAVSTAAAPSPQLEAVEVSTSSNSAVDEVLGSTTPATLTPEEKKGLKDAVSSSEVALPELPGMGKRLTVEEPLIINIPGMTDKPIIVQPPSPPPEEPPAPEAAAKPKAAPAEKAPDPAPEPAPVPIRVPTPPQVRSSTAAVAMAALIRRQRLEEIAAEIAAKKRTLSRKDAAFGEYQAQVEKNLIDIESRRSEILLGRIYRVVREVARENGVSIVVDKREILFGQDSVDLTAKVIKKLEGFPL
ncbi:MAG: OmpH family outer membrane protein [Elusimicrobiota bacterium]